VKAIGHRGIYVVEIARKQVNPLLSMRQRGGQIGLRNGAESFEKAGQNGHGGFHFLHGFRVVSSLIWLCTTRALNVHHACTGLTHHKNLLTVALSK
jgi:hypothetical protein